MKDLERYKDNMFSLSRYHQLRKLQRNFLVLEKQQSSMNYEMLLSFGYIFQILWASKIEKIDNDLQIYLSYADHKIISIQLVHIHDCRYINVKLIDFIKLKIFKNKM